MPTPDPDFQCYARDRGPDGFRRLGERHLPAVRAAAVRVLGQRSALAEDVVQMVFTLLAGKAASLPGDMVPGAWLHRQTVRRALNVLRTESRRERRERQFMETANTDGNSGASAALPTVALLSTLLTDHTARAASASAHTAATTATAAATSATAASVAAKALAAAVLPASGPLAFLTDKAVAWTTNLPEADRQLVRERLALSSFNSTQKTELLTKLWDPPAGSSKPQPGN